jgi:cell division protein FtsB
VNYLAAGGIQGLRPMRYEKRVARNRFIALVIILFLTLLGIVAVFVKRG